VPNGFALTVRAYYDALQTSNAWTALHALLDGLDTGDVGLLATRAAEARQIVFAATDSEMLREPIIAAYRQLEAQYGTGVPVAVRSSATAEDLPDFSFAGQHESYLTGVDDLFEACRRCFASIFTDRAIVYRINNHFDHFNVGLSVAPLRQTLAVAPRRPAAPSCVPPSIIPPADTVRLRDVLFNCGAAENRDDVVRHDVAGLHSRFPAL
jgi:pyruvate,water dikinase